MMRISTYTYDCSTEFRAQFDELMQEAFGFTFAAWQQIGAWNADYTCHTIIEDRRIQANASAYRMDLLVNGEPLEAWQIGAVATRKERRGEGLSRLVLQSILDAHPDGLFFLCANASVLDFYPRFGFRPMRERQPVLRLRRPLRAAPPGALRKLSAEEALLIAPGCFQRRACFSRVLDCTNAAPINCFHLINGYAENVYEIPGLETLLIAEQHGSTLTLIDVCATRPLALPDLLPYLGFPGADTLRFGFNPDWLGAQYELEDYQEDGALFFRGLWEIPGEFLLPLVIKT